MFLCANRIYLQFGKHRAHVAASNKANSLRAVVGHAARYLADFVGVVVVVVVVVLAPLVGTHYHCMVESR